MKRTAILLFICCMLSCLFGYSQEVTLSIKNAKLGTVLKEFKKQTGYSFFYNEALLSKADKVTIDLSKVQLPNALSVIFSKQTALDYAINGRIVTVYEKTIAPRKAGDSAASMFGTQTFSGKTVKGIVYNKRFERLANASVVVKGKNKGVSTGPDGTFKLEDLKEEDVLVVSFIGYNSKELPIKGRDAINFTLEDASNELDEVVAQGYSKTTKRLSTSSVAKVSGEEIARQPVMNPLLALQGKVPGMVLTPFSNYSAAPIVIDIRGRGLLSEASANPMIIIDGIPLSVGSNEGVAYGDGPVQGLMAVMSPAGSQSPLFGLNPRDIESIEILKDIGATAIYGSSGANGVILITTKRGKSGSSDLSVNVNYGLSKITRYYDMLNTQQYLEMRREAMKNDGLIPNNINAPDLTLWDTTRYTDWQREIWGRTATALNASVSYSGGTPQFTHRIAANYSRPDDITRLSGKNETMGLMLTLDRKSNNQKLSTSFTAGYTYAFSNMINSSNAATLPPNAPPIFDSSGNLNYKPWLGTGFETNFIPFESLLKPFESRTSMLNTALRVTYQLAKGLTLSSTVTYRTSNNDGLALGPIKSQNPSTNPKGTATFTKSSANGWSFEPQITYDRSLFDKGRLSVIAGATIRSERKESMSAMATGYTNDALLRSISQAPEVFNYNTRSPYKYAGVMGRLEYVWDNKYVVNGIFRRDGSSRFGPGRRFGNFGSVGVAWIASDEEWLKKVLSPVVSFLKFNANIGTAGNDGSGNYQYLSRWARGLLALYDNVVPMRSQQAVNQFYQWQLTRELNAGVQLNFKGPGQLKLGLNYYRRRLGNQLLNNPTPIYTGFPNVFGNWNATVQNAGWEANLQATFINKKHFRWNGSVNAAINRNKLLDYPQIERTPHFSQYRVGQNISTRYLLNYLGVDPMTGSYQFEDYNKDGLINYTSRLPPLTDPSDKQKMVDVMPVVSGGITQSLTYRNLSLFLVFDYKIQRGRNAYTGIPAPGQFGNIPAEVFNNRWQKPGDNARYAKLTTLSAGSFVRNESSLPYTDASFLRFSNISFSYQFAEKMVKRLGMKSCSFNINARNMFIITKYKGIDPELQSFGMIPPAKTITFGFALIF